MVNSVTLQKKVKQVHIINQILFIMGKNYIKHLLALMLLVCSTAAFAQATSTVSASFDGATMLVNITNPDYPFSAIQFDLELPEGIEVDFDGEYYAVDLGSRTNSRKHSYPECAIQSDGSLRVVIISMSNALYNGTEGDVATAALKVNGAADGDYQFTIKNVVLSDPSSSNERPESYTGWVAVEGGAVVGAGEEPVAPDYSAEIAALRALVVEAQATHDAAVEGTANGEYPAGAKAALQAVITEVNGKISDTMTLDEINACTAQINAAVTEFEGKVITNAGGDEGDDVAVASTVSASFDGATMLVNITNPDYPFSAIQFDLELPEGIEVDFDGEYYAVDLGSRTNSRKHSYPECAINSDGSLRVVIISMSNALYNGTEGDVATAALKVNGAADGDYQFTIKNVVLSDPSSSNERPESYTGWVAVEGGAVVGAGEEPVAPDYSAEIAALRALVVEAQATHDAAVEGTANGEYPAGAKAALQAVITEVNGKISDTMTLDEINACTAQINAAVTEFEGKVITNAGGDDLESGYTLNIVNAVARANKQVDLFVELVSPVDDIAAVEFYLYLPDGFTFAAVDTLAPTSKHTIVVDNDSTRILAYSLNNDVISSADGAIMKLTLNVAEGVADGYYTIEMKDLLLSSETNDYNINSSTSEIYVYSYIPGDMNDDGRYRVNDIVAIVSLIKNGDIDGNEHPVADVKKDGRIRVNDIVELVRYIKNRVTPTMVFPEHASNAPAYSSKITRSSEAGNYIEIAPFAIAPGEEVEVPVLLHNTVDLVGLDFILNLPEGLTITSSSAGSRCSAHENVFVPLGNNEFLIMLYPPLDMRPFIGASGDDVAKIMVKADENMVIGSECEIEAYDFILCGVNEDEEYNPAGFKLKVTVSDHTGIDEILAEGAEGNAAIYDLTGRAVKEATTPGFYIVGGKKIFVK